MIGGISRSYFRSVLVVLLMGSGVSGPEKAPPVRSLPHPVPLQGILKNNGLTKSTSEFDLASQLNPNRKRALRKTISWCEDWRLPAQKEQEEYWIPPDLQQQLRAIDIEEPHACEDNWTEIDHPHAVPEYGTKEQD